MATWCTVNASSLTVLDFVFLLRFIFGGDTGKSLLHDDGLAISSVPPFSLICSGVSWNPGGVVKGVMTRGDMTPGP